MKKKLWVPLIIVGLLAIFCLGFLLAGMTTPRSFDQLPQETGGQIPAREAHSIALLSEGSYPGFADTPVTAQQAAPGRRALYALGQQKYTWAFPLSKPQEGGILIYKSSGCTPEYRAYWDGRHLWLPRGFDGPWRGYRPSDPDKLDETLKSLWDS